MTVDRCRGQALVELAVVLPLLLLLGCGAVAVVQAARTQMALATIADASALVAARAPDALQACEAAHLELTTVLAQSRGLLPGPVTDRLDGLCVGPPPDPQSLLAPPGSGSYSIWFGYGGEDDSFCRVGSAPSAGQPTDGEVVATLAYRPDLSWVPLVGNWFSPRLTAVGREKVDPFRSREPAVDPTGDDC